MSDLLDSILSTNESNNPDTTTTITMTTASTTLQQPEPENIIIRPKSVLSITETSPGPAESTLLDLIASSASAVDTSTNCERSAVSFGGVALSLSDPWVTASNGSEQTDRRFISPSTETINAPLIDLGLDIPKDGKVDNEVAQFPLVKENNGIIRNGMMEEASCISLPTNITPTSSQKAFKANSSSSSILSEDTSTGVRTVSKIHLAQQLRIVESQLRESTHANDEMKRKSDEDSERITELEDRFTKLDKHFKKVARYMEKVMDQNEALQDENVTLVSKLEDFLQKENESSGLSKYFSNLWSSSSKESTDDKKQGCCSEKLEKINLLIHNLQEEMFEMQSFAEITNNNSKSIHKHIKQLRKMVYPKKDSASNTDTDIELPQIASVESTDAAILHLT